MGSRHAGGVTSIRVIVTMSARSFLHLRERSVAKGPKQLWSVRRPFKTALWIVLGIGVISGVLQIIQRFRPVETIEEAARNCLEAVENGNTRHVLKYFREDEVDLLDLNFEKLDSFINGFLLPRLKGFKPEGDPTLMPGAVTTAILRDYIHPEGRRVTIFLNFVETPDGPKMWHGTMQLISPAVASYPVDEEVRKAWEHTGLFAYYLTKALPDLERLALKRVAIPEDPEGIKLIALTWREYAKREQLRWEREAKRKWPFE